MKAFIVALQKFLAIFTSFICISANVPQVAPPANPGYVAPEATVEEAQNEENNDPELIGNEEAGFNTNIENKIEDVTAPKETVTENNETPAPADENVYTGAMAANANHRAAEAEEELQPVEVWDVSADQDGSVLMKFYDQIEGCIRNLFVPITAYAATETHKLDELDNEVALYGADDDAIKGYVVITGEGEMEEFAYEHFISTERYIETTERLLSDYYHVTVKIQYDGDLATARITELDKYADFVVTEGNEAYPTGTIVYFTDEIRNNIDMSTMLHYSPRKVEIEEGVTNISECAFAACTELKEIVLPSTIREIGPAAFAYCTSLTDIELPEGLKVIGESAFTECRSLKALRIPATVERIDGGAFENMAQGSVITCATTEVYLLIEHSYYTEGKTTVEIDSYDAAEEAPMVA